MDVDAFLCKNADLADCVFLAFMQFAKCHGIVKLFESKVKWIANDSLQENLNWLISTVPSRKASFKGILNTQVTFQATVEELTLLVRYETWDELKAKGTWFKSRLHYFNLLIHFIH